MARWQNAQPEKAPPSPSQLAVSLPQMAHNTELAGYSLTSLASGPASDLLTDGHLSSTDIVGTVPAWATTPWQKAMVQGQRNEDLVLMAIASHADLDLKERYLLDAYAFNADEVLVNYHVLSHCVHNPASSLCGLPIVDSLIRNDGDNMATLLNIALYYARLGDNPSALNYLNRAAQGELKEDYLYRHLVAVDASFRYHNIERNAQSLGESLRVAVNSSVTDYRQLSALCQINSGSTAVLGVCHQVGLRLQAQSKTLLDQLVGASLGRQFAAGDHGARGFAGSTTGAVADWPADAEASQFAWEGNEALFARHAEKPVSDDAWYSYLAVYRGQGELSANEYLYGYLQDPVSF
ncbi:hypothetical protein GCM10025791_32140 [Halioxenophilus aromaticivorans]|uniref:Uncharacterized protein n=2 Tax=Halioxenophilus aromaticivorans TaxID=1306992 RepID=A0AAV3U534_9ALTE